MRGRVAPVLAGALFAGALYVVAWRPLPVTGAPASDGFTRLAGVLHVHTKLSDGGGDVPEVIEAGIRAGLGFLAITDHNNLDAKPFEGYHGRLLVLVGTEISTSEGHVLALGVEDPVFRFSGDAEDALEDVHDLGGTAFAAHPTSPRRDLAFARPDLPGGFGIEVLNGDTAYRSLSRWGLLWTAVLYPLNPRYGLLTAFSPPTAALALWDRLLERRSVPGIAGADAHAHARVPFLKGFALPLPSYEAVFGLAQNHVLLESPLTGDARADAAAVVQALAKGRAYVALDALAPARDFSFEARLRGRSFTMGETAPPDAALRFLATGPSPASARFVLVKDGAPLAEGTGGLDVPSAGRGVYRVEVQVPGWSVPWILSNPIAVFPPDVEQERSARAETPKPPPPPAASLPLDLAGFQAEADTASSMHKKPSLESGSSRTQVVDLEFHLGVPTADNPHVSCALVSREPRRLAARTGVAFWARSDRPYRVWVQVRTENPLSRDGTEWWFASVKTGTAWERLGVPFSRMRSLDPHASQGPDLEKVRMVAFVLDQGAVKAGTEGRLSLADPAVY